jgi:hypothetical protein
MSLLVGLSPQHRRARSDRTTRFQSIPTRPAPDPPSMEAPEASAPTEGRSSTGRAPEERDRQARSSARRLFSSVASGSQPHASPCRFVEEDASRSGPDLEDRQRRSASGRQQPAAAAEGSSRLAMERPTVLPVWRVGRRRPWREPTHGALGELPVAHRVIGSVQHLGAQRIDLPQVVTARAI